MYLPRYNASLLSLCRRIWSYWTSKMLVRYILSSVCLRLSQFSQLSFIQHIGLCVFSLPIDLLMMVRIRILYLVIIIKSEVWPICHCLGLGYETMVCAVCLSIFLCSHFNRTDTEWQRQWCIPQTLWYKTHLRQLNCWSLRCSWSSADRRCSNYIFILNLTHGFNRLGEDNCKTRQEACKFWDLMCLISEIWQ